jgi:hypothetical protein
MTGTRAAAYVQFLTIILLAGISVVGSAPARAHHSFGVVYDEHKPVTLTGVISRIEWTNPHSFIFLDVKDTDGKTTTWNFEGYPPGVLFRNGWKRDTTMKVGDTVTIFGWQARKGGPVGHARQVTFADGTKKYFGPGPGNGDGGATPPVPDAGSN